MTSTQLLAYTHDWITAYKKQLAVNQNLEHWDLGGHQHAYEQIYKILKKGNIPIYNEEGHSNEEEKNG